MRILVGITGGIAAYKSATLVRNLTEIGHDVKVLPTQNALRFIGAATLEALSHNSIDPDLYTQVDEVKHITLAQEADLIIVAPATAAFIARYASGIADDLLLNVLLATTATVVVAPAMHSEMWLHPATVANIQTLEARGIHIIEPAVGRLTGKDTGVGRLPEPDEIISLALSLEARGKYLLGKKIVVAAGGTHEPIDEVRFIGNRSSGKQGIAIASEAKARGAYVILIAANIDIDIPPSIDVVRVSSTAEVQLALSSYLDADIICMPIAVSDFRVEQPVQGKIHRSDNEDLHLHLVNNPDLLKELATKRAGSNKPLLVGFAAEIAPDDAELIERGRTKLQDKGCDVLVANNVSDGLVFGSDSSSAYILTKNTEVFVSGTKRQVAQSLLDQVQQLLSA